MHFIKTNFVFSVKPGLTINKICFSRYKNYLLLIIFFHTLLLHLDILAAEQKISSIVIRQTESRTFLIIESTAPLIHSALQKSENQLEFLLDGVSVDDFPVSFFDRSSIPGENPCVTGTEISMEGTQILKLTFTVKIGLLPSVYEAEQESPDRFRTIIDIFPGNTFEHFCSGFVTKSTETLAVAVKPPSEPSSKQPSETVSKSSSDPVLKLSGYAAYDTVPKYNNKNDDPLLEFDETEEIRRVKLNLSGFNDDHYFKISTNFTDYITEDEHATLELAYINYRRHPELQIGVGLIPEPYGMEKSTSTKYTTFLERSLPMALAPEDNFGIVVTSHVDKTLFANLGLFTERSFAGEGKIKNAITARLGYSPVNKLNYLSYVGYSFSKRNPLDDSLRYSTRPEAHLANRVFKGTEYTNVENITLNNVELAFMYGPLSFQAEHATSSPTLKDGNNSHEFTSYYATISLFLTGESRTFRHGVFGRTKPEKSVLKSGLGAIEVAFRTSSIKEGNLQTLSDQTVAVNWYPVKYVRYMINYIRTKHNYNNEVKESSLYQNRIQLEFSF